MFSVLLAAPWVLLAFVTSAAQATPGDRFTAALTPTAVQPFTSQAYSVRLTNLGSSGDSADTARVTVPVGFVVDQSTLSASVQAHGGCSAATWTVALNLVTSSIDAAAADASGDLCPGATLTIGFSATAPLVEGVYEWTSTLLDGASPFTLVGSQPTVTVDGTPPPSPDLTVMPPDPSGSSTATFGFSDDDPTATFSCQLDGAAFAPCSTPKSYTGLGEGTHTFAVVAVDAAGNQSSPTSYSWTIDLTPPPAAEITNGPPNVTDSTDATFSFTDGDGSAAFRCRLDGAGFSSCASPVTYHNLAEGTHTFRVKAVDAAGNESTVTSYTWTIDLTNPVVTIDPASEPPDPTNQTSASFVFTANEEGSTFECRLDGAAFSACTSPATYNGLADGRHSFGVRATDDIGNQGLATVYEWTVDTVAPHATITSGPPAVSDGPSATFAFSSSEAATFACSLDGAAFSACSSPAIYIGLADGSHTFEVRGTDLAGNTDAPPASYSWQVVTPQGPDTTPPGPVQAQRRIVGYRLLKLQWSLPTDPDLAYVRVTRSRSSKGAAQAVVYQGKATTYSDRRFQNGQYYRYEIQAYDTSGNPSSLVRVVVPPSALLRSPRDGSVIKAPPLFLWAGVARATYYNVQVYRGANKVLSAWPGRARLKMRSRWVYNGRRYRLRKGAYRWWVWPAFGPRSKAAYGPLLGTGTFVVR